MFRVGYFQFRPRFGEPEVNLRRVLEGLEPVRADLVVLPELPFTGYLFSCRKEAMALAEPPRESSIVEALIEWCRRKRTYLSTGFAERAGRRCFNTALLLGPGGILQTYRKTHLFNDEKGWFDPGDLPLAVKRIRGVPVGTMICFDWAFPEVARTLTLRGARLLAHPSNLVLDYCQRAMLTRCLENGVYAVTCNRIGEDRRPHGRVRFTGRSQIVGPKGELLARAVKTREGLHVEEIDPARARDKMITPRNHLLRDRRPALYER